MPPPHVKLVLLVAPGQQLGGVNVRREPDRITGTFPATSSWLRSSVRRPRPWPDHASLISPCAAERPRPDHPTRVPTTRKRNRRGFEVIPWLHATRPRYGYGRVVGHGHCQYATPDVPVGPSREAAVKFAEGFTKKESRGNPWL
jgi:hypothetical protein